MDNPSYIISGELRDHAAEMLDEAGCHMSAEQLRAAPQAVSLDEVRDWTPYEIAITEGDQLLQARHRFYLDDDLQNLAIPADPTLPKLLDALGWKGGTVAQALEEVRRLRAAEDGIMAKAEREEGRRKSNPGWDGSNGDSEVRFGQGVAALLPEHGEVKP